MKEIFKQALHGKPHLHIGKAGVTDAVIKQISIHFKNKKILKVRFLSLGNFENMKIATDELGRLTNSKILDIRGKTCIIMDLSKTQR